MNNNKKLRTWSNFKKELDYKSEYEKKVISEMAKLVVQIVNRRKSLGLTQAQVAERAGITQAQVARLETSSSVPSIETVMKIAVALDMTVGLSALDEQAAGVMAHA
ncbi:helix-turn-helix domain-containing protein [Paenibacillus gallinarum]|uniref:Helix-turn-helix transcriptional regulator n=1 Tax=Paenibacillus gallinarum TaxID=2762232 RepID=A0ABR8T395_9BACL|nr:helix-turn-helix transcriptional regulator [Paenibacillus gallinarum]MBD7970248.1 helix-turn-helix transcriptional regulator [Paenibacillus gallinarum]